MDEIFWLGLVWVGISLATLIWPKYGFQTAEIRKDRLQELENGADEAFLEEKRDLQSYPNHFLSSKAAHRWAIFILMVGLAMMVWGIR